MGFLDFVSGAAERGAEIMADDRKAQLEVDKKTEMEKLLTPILADRERTKLALQQEQEDIKRGQIAKVMQGVPPTVKQPNAAVAEGAGLNSADVGADENVGVDVQKKTTPASIRDQATGLINAGYIADGKNLLEADTHQTKAEADRAYKDMLGRIGQQNANTKAASVTGKDATLGRDRFDAAQRQKEMDRYKHLWEKKDEMNNPTIDSETLQAFKGFMNISSAQDSSDAADDAAGKLSKIREAALAQAKGNATEADKLYKKGVNAAISAMAGQREPRSEVPKDAGAPDQKPDAKPAPKKEQDKPAEKKPGLIDTPSAEVKPAEPAPSDPAPDAKAATAKEIKNLEGQLSVLRATDTSKMNPAGKAVIENKIQELKLRIKTLS